ncbi:hypothetical protein QFZ30_004128 [Arthrobacter pascens]|uniref:HNH endonuclease signature motif containing protein n=1 Tax=Arthrobacter pascens TaxID=1677 RepID=UPI00278EC554|nr:HNH endonuclease signature motif containing protein [Arthrobacter pascens]MDQ0680746.1 hypothetical protein [Arthrobacter pascens]
MKAAAAAAPDFLALTDYTEAADYASQAEDLSRCVEYLQILGAGAVDRTRTQAITDAAAARTGSGRTWIIGWDNGTETLTEAHADTDADWPHGAADPVTVGEAGFTAAAVRSAASAASVPSSPADDGCRNTAEFLRARLRISIAEAHRRISLAAAVLPRPGITGHTQPAERPELATALAAGTVASRPATIITLALDRVRHHATEDTTARMEHALTRTAAENDADFLTRIARRWTEAIDQDGTKPTDHELRQRQGAFIRPARRGQNHLEIFATPDQFEYLLTVMNTATNPRTQPRTTDKTLTGKTAGSDAHGGEATDETENDPEPGLDHRTRPQQLLDGLVGACTAALATGTLPAAGGLRPQVMVTIDYRDLLDRLEHAAAEGPRYHSRTTGATPGHGSTTAHGNTSGTGSFAFTGPVTASTVRKIACDADIIPVLLGSEGRILDIGRTTRIFPPHIRKAISARDQGCAFPGCTIPAPWCEAHHITYWSHGGTTSTDNGTLLCTHHLIHKEL